MDGHIERLMEKTDGRMLHILMFLLPVMGNKHAREAISIHINAYDVYWKCLLNNNTKNTEMTVQKSQIADFMMPIFRLVHEFCWNVTVFICCFVIYITVNCIHYMHSSFVRALNISLIHVMENLCSSSIRSFTIYNHNTQQREHILWQHI